MFVVAVLSPMFVLSGCAQAPVSIHVAESFVAGSAISAADSWRCKAKEAGVASGTALIDPRFVDYFENPARVTRPFCELGMVSVRSWGRDTAAMVEELKDKASQLGAEGVIVLSREHAGGEGADFSSGSCSAELFELRAVAIAYDEAEEDGSNPNAIRRPASLEPPQPKR